MDSSVIQSLGNGLHVPLNDANAERAALGSAVLDAAALETLLALTKRWHFYSEFNQFAYDAMESLHAAGTPVDAVTLTDEMTRTGRFDECGGIHFILDLMEAVPHAAHVAYYSQIVIDRWKRREAETTLLDAIRDMRDLSKEVNSIVATVDLEKKLEIHGTDEKWMTSKELDNAEFPSEYLIEGVLIKGQFCITGGPSKGCKTTFLADVALGLASGAAVLNQFHVPKPVRVGMISAESGPRTLQETARRIARSKPWANLSYYENLFWKFDLPRLNEPGAIRRIVRYVRDKSLDVLILDPFYLMAGLSEDASNMFVVGELLAKLQSVGTETGVTLVIAHHFRKLGFNDQFAIPELSFLAWSGFEQFARQWMLLNRREAFDPETGLHKLWLSVGGSAGHGGSFAVDAFEGRPTDEGGRSWEVSVRMASEVQRPAKQERKQRKAAVKAESIEVDIEALMVTLAKYPDGIAKTRLRDESGLNTPKMKVALPEILKDGRAVVDKGKSNGSRVYLKLGQTGNRTNGQTFGQLVRNECPDNRESDGQCSPLLGGTVRPSDLLSGASNWTGEES